MTDLVYSFQKLVTQTCYKCSVGFAMTERFEEECRRTKRSFFCPAGHSQAFVESTVETLQREINQLKQREAMHEDEKRQLRVDRDAMDASRAEAERKMAKIAKRVSQGVCPGCNRTFANVARHMKSKHLKCTA